MLDRNRHLISEKNCAFVLFFRIMLLKKEGREQILDLYNNLYRSSIIHLLLIKLNIREMVARLLDHTVNTVDHEFLGRVCLP